MNSPASCVIWHWTKKLCYHPGFGVKWCVSLDALHRDLPTGKEQVCPDHWQQLRPRIGSVDPITQRGQTSTQDSGRTLSNGMPYFFRIEGEIRVILCLKKASQIWELPGKNPWRREGKYGGAVWVSSNTANKTTVSYLEPGAQSVFRVLEVCNTCRYIQMLATI